MSDTPESDRNSVDWDRANRAGCDLEFAQNLERQRDAFRDELSKVMPPDFKDWWENSKEEWPLVARLVIESLREREKSAWQAADRWHERVRRDDPGDCYVEECRKEGAENE